MGQRASRSSFSDYRSCEFSACNEAFFFFFFEVSELKRVSTRVEESRNISRDYVQFVCKYGGFKTLNDKLKIARKKNFSSRRLNYKQTEEYEKDDDSF